MYGQLNTFEAYEKEKCIHVLCNSCETYKLCTAHTINTSTINTLIRCAYKPMYKSKKNKFQAKMLTRIILVNFVNFYAWYPVNEEIPIALRLIRAP